MTNDSKDSRASSDSGQPSGWSEHVFRKKYTDPMKLKESLDEIYGQGKYQVIEKGGRWIISLPTPLSEKEIKALEEKIFDHY
ncbi:hypothetical protein N431DRAFT_489747 [Stipitochalara longipes BDJ]|nr:hypothetical protein N431DRAFT_489747 [Stipitochalara longipes BDJ]